MLTVRYRSNSGNAYVQEFGFEVGTQYAMRARATVHGIGRLTYDTPLVLSDSQVGGLADAALRLAYLNKTTYEFTLPVKYIALDPGDTVVLNWTDTAGTAQSALCYLQQVEVGADNTIHCAGMQTEPDGVHGSTGIPSGVGTAAPAATSSGTLLAAQGSLARFRPSVLVHETLLRLLELPPLRDADDNVGYYWGAAGVGNSSGWATTLLRSENNGESYGVVGTTQIPSAIGSTTTELAAPPRNNTAEWDTVNTVSVQLIAGQLTSVSPTDVLAGHNVAVIGKEIVGFCTATLGMDGITWTLSTLLRGIQGTDIQAGLHSPADSFILLDFSALQNDSDLSRGLGLDWLYAAVNLPDTVTLNLKGTRIKPEPVSHAFVLRDLGGSGDATISWVPRRRINWQWLDGVELGVDEPSEAYDIDIIGDAGVVRTITAFSIVTGTVGGVSGVDTGWRQASYTMAEQVADGVSGAINAVLYQRSPRIGRGMPRELSSDRLIWDAGITEVGLARDSM